VVDVGRVRKFLVGLYGEGLLSESMPDLTTRHFYVGRDLRVVVPLKHKLSGYHARWFAWFSPGPGGVDVDFPPRIHFTKPGDNQATRLELELERVGGVDGAIQWVAEKGLALQVSLSYTRVGKGRLGRVYSGDVHALYLVMIEFEDKKGTNNLESVKKVVDEVIDKAASFVEEPFIIFSSNKSYYLVFTLPMPIKAGSVVVRDELGRIVREYSLSEAYRALFNLVLRDKAYLGLDGKVITRFVDTQVAEPKRLLRIPGFKHEKSGGETIQMDVDLRPIEFDPDALTKSMLPKSVLADFWTYIKLPRTEEGRTGRKMVSPTLQTQAGHARSGRDKVAQWSLFIEWLRDNGIKLPDCRKRFAYLLGMYCRRVGMTEDACKALLDELVENPGSEHTRMLRYGYGKPQYLPSVYSFIRGDNWYSCTEVEELRKFKVPKPREETGESPNPPGIPTSTSQTSLHKALAGTGPEEKPGANSQGLPAASNPINNGSKVGSRRRRQ
jgi:hypothetical protein